MIIWRSYVRENHRGSPSPCVMWTHRKNIRPSPYGYRGIQDRVHLELVVFPGRKLDQKNPRVGTIVVSYQIAARVAGLRLFSYLNLFW